MDPSDTIVQTALAHYPDVQAVYLFGSFGTGEERPDSDVDVGLLLPPGATRQHATLMRTPCHLALEALLEKSVDLVSLRRVETVFQKEIIQSNRRIYCADDYAADEFEMVAMSLYQKLNEERREILEAFQRTGRAYNV